MTGATRHDGNERNAGGLFTRAFRSRLVQLGAELSRIDLRNFKTLSSDRGWQQIVARASVPVVTRVTGDAYTLAREVGDACAEHRNGVEHEPPSLPSAFLAFEQSLDSAVGQLRERGSIDHIDDISFLVCIELRQRIERLGRVGSANASAVISECDSAIRRTRKGIAALDAAIAAVESVAPALEFASELEHSIMVRRAYGRFRAYVASSRSEELATRLRGAFARINGLSEGSLATLLRVGDRLQILELQERIEKWLQGGLLETVDGERLWQDVVGFAEILTHVNRRQELLEHDRKGLGLLLGDAPITTDARTELCRGLEGLDPELDRLLPRLETISTPDLRAALAPIAQRYGVEEGQR